jgi:hypothetical protein
LVGGASELTPVARKVRKGFLVISGVVESPGIFEEDDAFWMNGKEIGYFQDGGHVFGLRLTKREISARRADLKTDPRVTLKASSDWIHMTLATPSDVILALELAAVAADAHRPAKGVPLAPPPTGVKLERMRRFH